MTVGDEAPRLKLLLIAPTLDGSDVGEARTAYHWVSRLAERHDVTVVAYHKRDRPAPSTQLEGVRVVEWTDLPLVGRFERWNSLFKPGYVPFYLRCRRWIKRSLADGERFDIAHQVIPMAMRYPCPAVGLGLPVVIGPVGGSLDNPPGFGADGDSAPRYVSLRRLDGWRLRWDPLLRHSYDGAACVLVTAPYAQQFLNARQVRRFQVMSDVALEALPPEVDRSSEPSVVRLLYVGRIVRTKGLRGRDQGAGRRVTVAPVPLRCRRGRVRS